MDAGEERGELRADFGVCRQKLVGRTARNEEGYKFSVLTRRKKGERRVKRTNGSGERLKTVAVRLERGVPFVRTREGLKVGS